MRRDARSVEGDSARSRSSRRTDKGGPLIAMTCGTGRNFSPAVSVSIANVSTEPTHVDAASVVRAILERYRRPDTQLEDLASTTTAATASADKTRPRNSSPGQQPWNCRSTTRTAKLTEPVVIATAIYFVFDILDELTLAGSWSRLVIMDRVSVDRIGAAGASAPSLWHEPFASSAAMTQSPPATRHRSSSRSTIPTATENGFASPASGNSSAFSATGMASSSAIPPLANSTARSTN